MHDRDFLARLHDLLFFGRSYALRDDLVGVVSWHSHADNTSAHVHLSDNGAILRAGEDFDLGSVLGNQSGKLARIGQHNNQMNVLLVEDG